jgi:hypothetical protein
LIAEFETAFGLYHGNMSCHPKSGERACLLILFVTNQWESAQVFKLFGFQDIEDEAAPPQGEEDRQAARKRYPLNVRGSQIDGNITSQVSIGILE